MWTTATTWTPNPSFYFHQMYPLKPETLLGVGLGQYDDCWADDTSMMMGSPSLSFAWASGGTTMTETSELQPKRAENNQRFPVYYVEEGPIPLSVSGDSLSSHASSDLSPFPIRKRRTTYSMPVELVDLVTGQFLVRYISIAEAAQAHGMSHGSLRDCINAQHLYKGLFFRHQGSDAMPAAKNPRRAVGPIKTPVEKLDNLTGAVVAEYDSVKEAAVANGISITSINTRLSGRTTSPQGLFMWRCKKAAPLSSHAIQMNAGMNGGGIHSQSHSQSMIGMQMNGGMNDNPMMGMQMMQMQMRQQLQPIQSQMKKNGGKNENPMMGMQTMQMRQQLQMILKARRNEYRVEEINPATKKVIARYDSVKEAARAKGVSRQCIYYAMSGRKATSEGFRWRWQESTDIEEEGGNEHNLIAEQEQEQGQEAEVENKNELKNAEVGEDSHAGFDGATHHATHHRSIRGRGS
jgi:hypothetical protein